MTEEKFVTKIVHDTTEAESLKHPSIHSEVLKIDTEASRFAEKVVSLLTMVKESDSILKKETIPFDFTNPPMLPNMLALQMFETMHNQNGVSLSAPQVGLPWRVFVAGTRDQKQIFFNAELLEISDKFVEDKEGCLSFPLLVLKIKRPEWIKVKSQNGKGDWREDMFSGLTARVILHELEHMDGHSYTDHVSSLTYQMANEKRKKTLKKLLRSAKKQRKIKDTAPLTAGRPTFLDTSTPGQNETKELSTTGPDRNVVEAEKITFNFGG